MTCFTQYAEHPYCCKWQYSFSFILLCILFCHIFLTHSSVSEYLGCFDVLVVINSAAVNIGMHVPFQLMFFFFSPEICSGVGLLDHMAVLFLVFEGTSILFSIVAVPIYRRVHFSLYALQQRLFADFFMMAILVIVSKCFFVGLNYIHFITTDVENLCMCFFGEMWIQFFCTFLISFYFILFIFFVCFILSCRSCLHILEIHSLSVSFSSIFSLSEGNLFMLFIVSFAM